MIVPARIYVWTFLGLLVLTVVTVAVSLADLGAWSVTVALLIASTKASLVALFFMHVRWASPLTRLIIVSGLSTLGLLLVLTLTDILTRDAPRVLEPEPAVELPPPHPGAGDRGEGSGGCISPRGN